MLERGLIPWRGLMLRCRFRQPGLRLASGDSAKDETKANAKGTAKAGPKAWAWAYGHAEAEADAEGLSLALALC